MQRIISLLKAMLQGGLLVVLPTLLFIMLIGQVVSLLVAMVGPIADLFPEDLFAHAKFPLILAFKPALLVSEGNQREFVYVIEDHGNGDLTILKPWAPTAFSGSVRIVPKEQVQSMDISLAEVTMVLNHLGMGAQKLIGASNRIRK